MTSTPRVPAGSRSATSSDRVRQVIVVVTGAIAAAGLFLGRGAFGTPPIEEAAGGAFASDGSVLAPAGPAFAIWSIIYAGLLLYALWQLLPSQAAREVHRSIGYWVSASAILNLLWILSAQAGWVGASMLVIALLLAVLVATFIAVCRRKGRSSLVEAVLVDGTVGIYLGWVLVATDANLSAWLAGIGADGWTSAPGWPGVIALIVTGVIALWIAWRGGRLAPGIATAWALAWIAAQRQSGALPVPQVAWTAALLAVVILIATVWFFVRRIRQPKH